MALTTQAVTAERDAARQEAAAFKSDVQKLTVERATMQRELSVLRASGRCAGGACLNLCVNVQSTQAIPRLDVKQAQREASLKGCSDRTISAWLHGVTSVFCDPPPSA